MDAVSILKRYLRGVAAFRDSGHRILAVHEAAPSRVVVLDDAYRQLSVLSLRQDELIRQGLRCVEHSLFRAAHVMVWAAMMDFIEQRIVLDAFKKLRKIRPNWNVRSIEAFRESYPEYQIIDAGKDMALYSKTVAKALQGLLNKRNECAHPSDYYPDLNQTLGYISEVMSRIEMISGKKNG